MIKKSIFILNPDYSLLAQNYFDTFMTDPTPTEVPFIVFANVGINLLNKNKTSIGYFSYLSSGMFKEIGIQKAITKMGLLITDVIPFFTEYEFIKETYSQKDLALLKKYSNNNSEISFFEHLLRVETTKETEILKIDYTIEDLFGKATKKVLKNPNKDPAFFAKDPYIINIVKETIKKYGGKVDNGK